MSGTILSSVFESLRPAIMVFMALAVIGIQPLVGFGSTAEASSPSQKVPPGQLTRKTIVGTIESIDGSSSITVGTKFGSVLVLLSPQTVVNIPPEKGLGVDVLNVGDKVVVNLNKSPLSKKGDDDGGDEGGTTDDQHALDRWW